MNFRLAILVVFSILGIMGCSFTMKGIYGMNKLKLLNDQTIIQYSEKFNIPLMDNYKLDSSYVAFLSSIDTLKYKEQIKNHLQPLQVLYYNKNGKLESFQINCYTGGFPNLNWDRESIMNTFPPKNQAPIDNLIPLKLQLEKIIPLHHTNIISIENYDYIVFVYWNRFMGRQSKRLIHFVQENYKLAKDFNVKIIYVNTDNVFASFN